MTPTRMRLMGAAAALSAIAIAAPVSTAGADTPGSIIGPVFTTSAAATFINTNTQVSAAPVSAGDQIAP